MPADPILVSEIDPQKVLPPIACQLPGRQKNKSEIETNVRKVISLAPCVFKMNITQEHVQVDLNLHLHQ